MTGEELQALRDACADRIQQSIARERERQQQARNSRAQFARNRTAGLLRRYAAKTARGSDA